MPLVPLIAGVLLLADRADAATYAKQFCPPGQFIGEYDCQDCPRNTFWPQSAMEEGSTIPPVYECVPCAVGKTSVPGSITCVGDNVDQQPRPVPAGRGGGEGGSGPRCAECCDRGEYRLYLNTASSYCERCAAGQYWKLPAYAPDGATERTQAVFDCVKCPRGKYQPAKGQVSCKVLPGAKTSQGAATATAKAAPSKAAAAAAAKGCVLKFSVKATLQISSGLLAAPSPLQQHHVTSWLAMATGLPLPQIDVHPHRGKGSGGKGDQWAADGDCRSSECSVTFDSKLLVSDSVTALGIAELFEMGHFDALLNRRFGKLRFRTTATETAALTKPISCAEAAAPSATKKRTTEIVVGAGAFAALLVVALRPKGYRPKGYRALPGGAPAGKGSVQMG